MPSIFENRQPYADYDHENVDVIEPIEPIDTNVQQEMETNEESLGYDLLKNLFATEKSEWNVREQKLHHEIKMLQISIGEQKKHIKFLNQKFNREKKTKDSLRDLLEELYAQKLLDSDNLDTLKVLALLMANFCFFFQTFLM